jgi:thymidylate synthase ThyX
MISATVVAASTAPEGSTLFTLELRHPRFIDAEINKYRNAAKSTGSSRAIPTLAITTQVEEDPFVPNDFRKNQAGMQGVPVDPETQKKAEEIWRRAAKMNAEIAKELLALGIHKQHANRWMEPAMMVSSMVTGVLDAWNHLVRQRDHQAAQPEFQDLAVKIREAINASRPTVLENYQWHLPMDPGTDFPIRERVLCSVGRCAAVSYHRQGQATPEKAIELAKRLMGEDPPHLSPFEHAAKVISGLTPPGCFGRPWMQARHSPAVWGGVTALQKWR